MNELDILLYLGKRGAFNASIPVTTSRIGSELNESQQNISRWLIKMEKEGLIYRKSGLKGYLIQITPSGEKLILDIKSKIEAALDKKRHIELRGIVVKGIGDGRYYMSLDEYTRGIEDNFGFKPFPGTLNVKITDMSDVRQKEKLNKEDGIKIEGFTKGKRIFGALHCFKCRIKGINCALVMPERSHHPFDVLEIVSKKNLRRELNIKEGDHIKVIIDMSRNLE